MTRLKPITIATMILIVVAVVIDVTRGQWSDLPYIAIPISVVAQRVVESRRQGA